MTWQIEALAGGLGRHAIAWDELNERICARHPLLDSAFISSLLRHFGDGRQVMCTLTQDGKTSGMCILELATWGIWRSFAPSQAQIGSFLLQDANDIPALCQALPGVVNAVDLLRFDPHFGGLHFYGTSPIRWQRHAVTIDVPLVGDFEAYWQSRPKKLRDNLRRHQRRAEAESGHALSMRMYSGPAALRAAVERYAILEARGWKGRMGTALGSSASQLAFYTELMHQASDFGKARVYELWFGDRHVASRLVITQGTLVVALKTTYDERHRDWAPGRLLLHRVLEDAFLRWPGRTFAFYTNASIDQMSWANVQRSILNVTVYPDRLRALAGGLWRVANALWRLARWPWRASNADKPTGVPDTVCIRPDVKSLSVAEASLLSVAEATNVEWGLDWLEVYERTVMRNSDGLRLFTLCRGALPVAVLPVNLDPGLKRLGGSVGSLSNFYSTLWSPALAPDVVGIDLVPLLNAVRKEGGRPPSLHFTPMDPQSHGYRMMRKGLRAAGYAVFEYVAHGNWYLPVQGDWKSYLAGLHGSVRSTIKRMHKRLLAEGARIEIVTTDADLPRAMTAYAQVYAGSWKRPEPVADFMPELARLCARRGWLRLGIVWLDERPIAAQLWIVSNRRAAIYKVAYDEAFKHYAVGTVLTAVLMEHVIDSDGVREVDYLIGDDEYKKRWMTHRRERFGMAAYDIVTVLGLWGALKARLSPVRQRLLQSARRLRASIRAATGAARSAGQVEGPPP